MNKITYFCRKPNGAWVVTLADQSHWLADLPTCTWSTQPHEAIRFSTQADAQACAQYVHNSMMGGIKCVDPVVLEV